MIGFAIDDAILMISIMYHAVYKMLSIFFIILSMNTKAKRQSKSEL